MAKKFVRIIEDIEEALSREVRHIIFWEGRYRGDDGIAFKELFSPFTGELIRQPIEPRFYDDSADSLITTHPRFTLRLLKLYEDRTTKRGTPPYGEELVSLLPGPGAYKTKFGGEDAKTTNGGGDSTIDLTHRKIREVLVGDWIRLLTKNNIGTYRISAITLNGNGPHTLTLSNDLLTNLPIFNYNKNAGIIAFREFVDLKVVKIGDTIVDNTSTAFVITAVNAPDSTLAIAPGSAIANGANAKITRIGNVLQNDDSDENVCYQLLDPTQPIADKGTRYVKKSQLIPYTFLYYIKIVSRERDDHIAVADRMMQVFNPPRGALGTVIRSQVSAHGILKKDANAGDKILYVDDSSIFYPNDRVRILDNLSSGEEAIVDSVNNVSNAVTIRTSLTASYSKDRCGLLASNVDFCALERDFMNHETEDKEDMQLWVHRFTFRIEAWVESRIEPLETSYQETTEREVGDVNYIKACLENMDAVILDENLIT